MRRWSRRTFLGAAAAVCIGCTDESDATGPTSSPPTTTPPTMPTTPDTAPRGSIRVDTVDAVRDRLQSDGALYVPSARAFLVPVPEATVDTLVAAHDAALHEGFRLGLAALYQKCPHLGCRVPHCESSGWFECACHGTAFNAVGEHQSGPGDRGLDLFEVHVVDDVVHVLPRVHRGLPVGAGVVVDVARGPHCVEIDPGNT